MKLLVPDLYSYSLDEILSVLIQKNYSIVPYHGKPRSFYYDPVFQRNMIQKIEEQEIDVVFSLQFLPILSNICDKLKIPYISWCYNDQINRLLLSDSVFNNCNFIFHTDSKWVLKLQRLGVKQVFYLPWAARTIKREQICAISSESVMDIAVFDTGNTEALRLYIEMLTRLDRRTRGFLDGLIQAQGSIYGFNFIENVLNDEILSFLQKAASLPVLRGSTADMAELYAFQILYPVVTKKELDSILRNLEEEEQMHTCFYSSCFLEHLKHIKQSDLPTDSSVFRDIYINSKINLLIAPREIQNGIPVQAMDIMGCGGFLMTNFQNDYLQYFEPGTDYIYYESTDDISDKLKYYLQHEEKRIAISRNAFHNIMQNHTFELRLEEMIDLLNLN